MYVHLSNLHLAMCVYLIYSLPPPPYFVPDINLTRYTTILLMVPIATSNISSHGITSILV